ncbi:MAG: PAS domain-containing protein, partial [Nitrospirae bacterium]|nr:PAS domain-containing protein [Nitrospirota bacterium]
THLEAEKQQVVFEKRRTEDVVATAADGVIVVDAQGRIVMMNPAAERLYGAKFKDKVGHDIRDVLGADRMVTLSAELGSGVAPETAPGVEVRSAPETEKTLRASTAVVQNPDGKVVGMVSALSHVAKVRELERMKTDFVASVSHELRTPLASVKQALGLLRDGTVGAVTEDQSKMLALAQRNVERLMRLINDLLDLSKIEAGKLVVNPSPNDLAEIVDEVGQTMTLFAQSRNVKLSYHAQKGLPKVHVDRDRMIQVFTNLVGNAVKFTPPEGKVSVGVADLPRGGIVPSQVKVAVTDSGRGIPKGDVERIFENFVQVGQKSTDVHGTGLGLPIAKALVEQHGGRIWVESEVGKGSKFTVSLPTCADAPRVEEPVRSRASDPSWWKRLVARWRRAAASERHAA